MANRLSRLAPLTGALFSVLGLAAFLSSHTPPGVTASGSSVIVFYKAHSSGQQSSDLLWAFAWIFLLFFAGSLRSYMRRTPETEGLSALLLAGAAVMAAGGATYFGFDYTLAVSADHLQPAAAQALNLLALKLVFPLAVGGCVFAVASGVAILRGAPLPKWLGWLAIVIGIVLASPAAVVALIVVFVWVAIVSVLVWHRGTTAAASA